MKIKAKLKGSDYFIGDDYMDVVREKWTHRRFSQDKVINTFGKSLLYMCNTLGLSILNGLCNGELMGSYTYVSDSGCSVIDYFLMSSSMYAVLFDYCNLHLLSRTDCKHLPVSLTFNSPEEKVENVKTKNEKVKVDKFILNEEKVAEFKEAIGEENVSELLNQAIRDIDSNINEALNNFNECIKKAAICMRKQITINGNKPQNWFDLECKEKRKEL